MDVFTGAPYALTRSFADTYDVQGIVAVPQPGTAADLVGLGTASWPGGPRTGALALYRPSSGQLVRQFPLCGRPVRMVTGSIDASGEPRLIYAASPGNGVSKLCVADLASGATLYEDNNESGPFSALARGDLGGNGSDQVAVVGRRAAASPVIRIFDAATGDLLRATAAENVSSGSAPFLATAQLDADPQLELIIASHGPRIEARDGQTLELQWLASVGESWDIIGLAITDANGDGTPDVLVLTGQSRLVVLDGRNGLEIWRSMALPGANQGGVVAFNLAGAPHAAIGVDRGVYLIDLARRAFTASFATDAPVVALRQWPAEAGCRIGVATAPLWSLPASLSVHVCDTLARVTKWALPFSLEAFWPVDDSSGHFLLAGDRHLHELKRDGVLATWPADLGYQLAHGNQGDVRVSGDGTQVDATLGSDYQVGRLQLRLDDIFVGSFEARP